MNNTIKIVARGEVYIANLGERIGSEQGGIRPVLVIQNNIGNRHSPTTIVAPLTSKTSKKPIPTHFPCKLDKGEEGMILLEQLVTIDKSRLHNKVYTFSEEQMTQIDKALKISIGIF